MMVNNLIGDIIPSGPCTFINQPIRVPKKLKPYLDRTHIFCRSQHVILTEKKGGLPTKIKGVYVIFGNEVEYIGRAIIVRERLRNHFGIHSADRLFVMPAHFEDRTDLLVVVFPISDFIDRVTFEHVLINDVGGNYNVQKN